ncbi:MAG: endolytic transglycosylase MltG [Lachnospiraceae bacterium]|nr:endolytic transglycosylase MltG [Lachnospiraceae bacterium]
MDIKKLIGVVASTILKVVVYAAIIMFIWRAAYLAYDYGYRIFEEAPMSTGNGRVVTVTIPENMSAKEMGTLLEQKGLIRDANLFILQYYLSEYKVDLLPGTFELSTAMTVDEILKTMTIVPEEAEEESAEETQEETSE